MFDLGWTEMMLIGIVALIVVGPKELPGLFRTVGHAVGKARGMARDFSRAMESAADETGLRDIDRTIRAAARPAQFGKTAARDALGLGPDKTAPDAKATGAAPTGLEAGTPLGSVPSPATEALAAQRREEAARRAEGAVERAEAALRRAQDAAARARVEAAEAAREPEGPA